MTEVLHLTASMGPKHHANALVDALANGTLLQGLYALKQSGMGGEDQPCIGILGKILNILEVGEATTNKKCNTALKQDLQKEAFESSAKVSLY